MHDSELSPSEFEKITESLRLCRAELAALQEQLETLLEERNRARRRANLANKRSVTLSTALARQLANVPVSAHRSRLQVMLSRHPSSATSEEQDVAVIEASGLFRAAWYLRHNPDAVESGLRPALHFLRVGAPEERDPGPQFSTRQYLDKNPVLRATGVNALLHHELERTGARS